MEHIIADCPNCQAFVQTELVGGYEFRGGRFVLLRCGKCFNPVLATQENVGNMVEGDIWKPPVRIYPLSDLNVNPKVPKKLRDAFQEAAGCFQVRSYTATAIMCRKTLEGICASHNIRQRNLMQSIRELRDQGQINEQLAEWADALRIVGNEAAHDVDVTISQDDARDMLDFTNAILDYMFSFKEKFDQFQLRRRASNA